MRKQKAAATSETLVAQGAADLAGDVGGAAGTGEGSTGDAGGDAGAGEGSTGDAGGDASTGEGLTGDAGGNAGTGEGLTGDADGGTGADGLFMPDEIRVRSVSTHGRWRAGTKFGSRFETYKVADFTDEQLAAICSDDQLIVEIGKICSGDELIAEITQK